MVKKNSARDKKRTAEYNRIKSNLFKKAREFSILCEVPVCTIIYPENGDDQTQKPEVFSVNCGSEVPPDEIIQRYLAVPEEEKRKRSRTGTSSKICENDPNLKSVNQDYGANNECSVNQMLDYLDSKIDDVKRKIAEKQSESETQIISNHQVDYNNQVLLMGSNSSSCYHDQITGFNHNAMPLQLHQYDNHHTQKDEVFSFSNNQVAPAYFDQNVDYNNQVGSHVDDSYSRLMDNLNSLSSYYDQITRFNHDAMPLQLDQIQCYNHHTRKYEVFSFYGGFNSDGNNAYEVGSNIGENYEGFNGMNMMGPTYYS